MKVTVAATSKSIHELIGEANRKLLVKTQFQENIRVIVQNRSGKVIHFASRTGEADLVNSTPLADTVEASLFCTDLKNIHLISSNGNASDVFVEVM